LYKNIIRNARRSTTYEEFAVGGGIVGCGLSGRATL